MSVKRSGVGVAVCDGKLYAIGGSHYVDNKWNHHKSVECLDLKDLASGWQKVADMSIERYGVGVAVCDGKLYAVGGLDGGRRLKSVECLRIAY